MRFEVACERPLICVSRCRAHAARPSARNKVASRLFIDRAATPPREGNNILDASCTQIKGEILKSDKSCISNPKSEMSDWTAPRLASYAVQSEFSDFGFEMQDLSDFEMSFSIDESSMLVPSRGGE